MAVGAGGGGSHRAFCLQRLTFRGGSLAAGLLRSLQKALKEGQLSPPRRGGAFSQSGRSRQLPPSYGGHSGVLVAQVPASSVYTQLHSAYRLHCKHPTFDIRDWGPQGVGQRALLLSGEGGRGNGLVGRLTGGSGAGLDMTPSITLLDWT